MSDSEGEIRPSALAGTWYDADAERLSDELTSYLRHVKARQNPGKLVGLISPHAGYSYSGPVAAHAYRLLMGRSFDTVVIVAPNHRESHLNFSSVMTVGGYETPLGIVRIDSDIAAAVTGFDPADNIKDSLLGHIGGRPDNQEHSLEIQLPFLQTVLDDFKLVPIVMGEQSRESCEMLARALAASVKDKNVLLVASSDLSHFLDDNHAASLDAIVEDRVNGFDPEGLLEDLSQDKSQACGGGPIAAVMMAGRELGANAAKVLKMANSGDVTGDTSNVVGYMAAAITIKEEGSFMDEADAEEEAGVDLGLSIDEKNALKVVVEETLESVVKGGAIPAYAQHEGKLGEKWGAFVTLNKDDHLRGCIGHIIGTQPLIDTVAQMTRAAALEDPRFQPVQPSELNSIKYEISVLTPIREIDNVEEIVVGRDGIIISRGYNRGLLLPQVATEYGWDRETFLEQTCNKAGLPKSAWSESDTKIEIFSAEIVK